MGRLVAMLLVSAILACCSASSSVPPATPSPRQADCAAASEPRHLCVIVLGDSIASGSPVVGNDRWWVRLESLLRAALPDRHVAVDSWALAGSHIDALETVARDQSGLGSYDMAIIIEGVNDEASIPIEVWGARYEAAVVAIERRGTLVIVATPPPSFENGAFAARYDRTADAVRAVAASTRPILDIAARWRLDGAAVASTYYADLIHQNTAGQRLMSEMARDVILQALDVS